MTSKRYESLEEVNSINAFAKSCNELFTDIEMEFFMKDREVFLEHWGVSFNNERQQDELLYLIKIILMRLVTEGYSLSQAIDNSSLLDYVLTQEHLSLGNEVKVEANIGGGEVTTIVFKDGTEKTIEEIILENK
jgi:hypothetical protein